MATPQELQNALMLKKTQGLTTEQAVNQARIPVTATSQINQDRLAQNQASRQGTPAPVLPTAPVTPTAPTTTPNGASLGAEGTVTAPKTEQNINSQLGGVIQPNGINSVQPINAVSEMPATPKVDATPGITQDTFQQAKLESEKIKAQNDATMTLNKQQADLKAQERQQVAQETAKATTPVNQKDVLNALVSGVSVAPQNTAAYRNAQMQYKTYQKFATMTPTQLVDNMKMGEIGTETAQLLASNPNYIKAKEDFDKFQKNQSINNMIKSVAEGATGKTTAVDHYQNASDAIAKKLGITETNADAFARIVSKDPETLQLTKTVSNIAKQLNTLNTERNAVYEDLKKQYPDLSASAIMTLMAGRTKEATAQIDALNSSLTLTQADLKMAMEMAKAEYDATKEDITLQAGLAKEDRAMQNALDLSQAQFDQKLAQQAQLTNDPTTAITTMIDEYKKLGIPFTRSTQQVISDFETSGKDLPTYLSELQGQIQSKPEYKRYQAIQTGQLSEAEKLASAQSFDLKKMGISNQQDIQKLVAQYDLKNSSDIQSAKIDLASKGFTTDQVDSIIRSSTGNWKGARGTTLLTAPDGTIIPSRLSQTTNKNNGKECGEYVNDITGIGLGSTWESKKKKVDSSIVTPTVGDTAIWIPDPSNKNFAKYGHAGIVTASDGTNVTIKSSNLNGRGEISTVTVPISKITQTGGFANTSIKGTSTDKPLSDKQYTQYNQATSKFVADPNVKAFEAALAGGGDLIASLKSANGPGDVGAVFGFMKSLDPASVVKEGEFELAAKSAGVWEQFKNIPANKLEGTILTEDQRKAFGKLAFEYIKQKGKLYDIKYNDYTKILKNQGIPDTYYPTKMTDVISSVENGSSPQKSDFLNSPKSIATEFTKGLTSIK